MSERDVLAVFEAYRRHHPNAYPTDKPNSVRALLSSDVARLIRARLRVWWVGDLISAVDGCHRSRWHSGSNPGGQTYQSLALIMRTDDHVQRFIESHADWRTKNRAKAAGA